MQLDSIILEVKLMCLFTNEVVSCRGAVLIKSGLWSWGAGGQGNGGGEAAVKDRHSQEGTGAEHQAWPSVLSAFCRGLWAWKWEEGRPLPGSYAS